MAEPAAAGVSSLPREVREQLAELELELSEGEERRAAPGSRLSCPALPSPALPSGRRPGRHGLLRPRVGGSLRVRGPGWGRQE